MSQSPNDVMAPHYRNFKRQILAALLESQTYEALATRCLDAVNVLTQQESECFVSRMESLQRKIDQWKAEECNANPSN